MNKIDSSFLREKKTYLWRSAFLEVDHHTPAKVKFIVLDLDHATGLKEREGIGRVGNDCAEVGAHLVKLRANIMVRSDLRLIRHNNLRVVIFLLPQIYT